MAIANGLCDAGRATLEAHEDRLDKLEQQNIRFGDKLDGIGRQMTALIVAVATLALTLAANLALKLLGG